MVFIYFSFTNIRVIKYIYPFDNTIRLCYHHLMLQETIRERYSRVFSLPGYNIVNALSDLDSATYHQHPIDKPFESNGHTIDHRSRRAIEPQLDIFDTSVEFFAKAMRGNDTQPGQGTRRVNNSLSERALELLRSNADKPWIEQLSVDEAILMAFNAISSELMSVNPYLVFAFYKLLDYTKPAGATGISAAIGEGKYENKSLYPKNFTAPDSTSKTSMGMCGGISAAVAIRDEVGRIMNTMEKENIKGRSGGRIQLKYLLPSNHSTVDNTMQALLVIIGSNLAKTSQALQII